MKKLILITGILLSTGLWADELTLACEGSLVRGETSSTGTVITNDGSANITTFSNSGKRISQESIIFHLDDGFESGWIKIPDSTQPVFGKKERFPLQNLKITDDEIKARYRHGISKPKISINRLNGVIQVTAMGTKYKANCEKIDLDKRKF